jgi:hypothetical protein
MAYRAADRLEFGFIKRISVGKHLDAGVAMGLGIRQGPEEASEILGIERGARRFRDAVGEPWTE